MASSTEVNLSLLASEWRSKRGRLSIFNRVLAIELAKHSKVHVSVLVPRYDLEEMNDARSKNVTLVQAKSRPGLEEKYWVCFPPDDLQIDVVIGHGAVGGSQAQIIRENRRCKWIQFVHTEPEELGMFKDYSDRIEKGEQKHQTEVELCAMADFIVAVGPKLAEAYRSYLRSNDKDQSVFDLTPGIFDEFSGVKQATEDGDKCRVLAFGRGDAEDFKLSGFDIAAKAVGKLQDAILFFDGLGNKPQDVVADNLGQCDNPPESVLFINFQKSMESLKGLFRSVDVVIMPLRTEGFGLAALEALSAGLPILVGGNSGFGKALSKVRFGSNCVIQSEDPAVWAEEIKKVWARDRGTRLDESDELRKNYAKEYSWAKQCNDLVELVLKMTADEAAPSSKRNASNTSIPEPGAGPSTPKSRRLSDKFSTQKPEPTRLDVVYIEGDSSPDPVSEGNNETETGSREHMKCAQTKSESEMKVGALSENWIGSTCEVGETGTVWRLRDTLAACVITFPQNAVKATVLFRCTPWQLSTIDSPPLQNNEALVSNVIVLACDDSLGSDFTGDFDEEVSVALSHSAADLKGYEVVMRELVDPDNNEWKDLKTTNIWKASDTQCDLCSTPRIPFSEAKVTRCSVFAVICRLKSYTYSTHGRRKRDFTCRVPEYPDVSVKIPASVVHKNGDFQLTLKVQEIPQQWFDQSEIICPVLHIACSPAIQLVEPAIITIPTSLQENKNGCRKLPFKNAHVRLLMNSDEETSHWTEITEQLSRPAHLTKGVVTFQVTHFTRFWAWLQELWSPNPKDRADRPLKNLHLEDRADRLTQHFPLNAGFFACLCRTDNIAGKSMLRYCCYPIALEEPVKKSICSSFDVFFYGYGNSLEPLCPDDVIHLELGKGLKPTDDEDASNNMLRLRFLRDWKFENDVVVHVSSEHVPKVEFFRYLDEKPPIRRRFRDEKPPRRRRKEKNRLCLLSMVPPSTVTKNKHSVKAGNPSDDELEKLSKQLGDGWETLGRRLGYNDAELSGFCKGNNRVPAEEARRMLISWKQKEGSDATYQVLYDALIHEFVSCKLLAEKFCCN